MSCVYNVFCVLALPYNTASSLSGIPNQLAISHIFHNVGARSFAEIQYAINAFHDLITSSVLNGVTSANFLKSANAFFHNSTSFVIT